MNKISDFFPSVFLIEIFDQHHDRGLTKFHAGYEQLLVCVVTNNTSYPTIRNNNTAYHAENFKIIV